MSVKRRLIAAVVPAAGVTAVVAALVLTGQPANAAVVAGPAVRDVTAAGVGAAVPSRALVDCDALAAVGVTLEQCEPVADDRGQPGYGGADDDGYGETPGPGATPGGAGGEGPSGGDEGPTRGQDGYGAGPDEVPPTTPGPIGGVSPDEVPGEGGGDTLPVTGSPVAALVAIGGLLTAAGVGLRWAMRRRRVA